MMRTRSMIISTWFLPLALLLTASLSSAQGTFLEKDASTRMPTPDEIDLARQKTQEALKRLPEAPVIRQQFGGVTPSVKTMPTPAAKAPDIATIAEKYKALGRTPASQTVGSPDLMVFVSLSMPKETLARIIDQAELTGATLVFRGLKGNSMTKMGEEISTLIGTRTVSAVIHPPAFQQFTVTRVPVVVIARPDASSVMDDGCSKADSFVKVTGDVTLDYALDYIERKSPGWASTARRYRAKLGGGTFQ